MRKKISARRRFRKHGLRPPDYTNRPKLCFPARANGTMIRQLNERQLWV